MDPLDSQILTGLTAFVFTLWGCLNYYASQENAKLKKAKYKNKNKIKHKNSIQIINNAKQKAQDLKKTKRFTYKILPEIQQLTTREAAYLLNISRPLLIQLLEEGKIPHRKIGMHRRILLSEVINFKKSKIRNWSRINELELFFLYTIKNYHY